MIKILKNQIDNQLKQVCLTGCDQGVFSACAGAVCFTDGEERECSIYACGTTGYMSGHTTVTEKTFFDLASLTKPLSTALCIIHLIVENKLALHTSLADVYASLSSSHGKITIGRLLAHLSGLPPYRSYFAEYEPFSSRGNQLLLVDRILDESLQNSPETQSVYSDLGYILLGDIIERVSGRRLDEYFSTNVTDPLGISDSLFFLPRDGRKNALDCAATEYCYWRKKLIQGEVHDENCWFLGGVAGHAGLFGNIYGVTALVEKMLTVWRGDGQSNALGGNQFAILFQNPGRAGARYIGFDRPTPGISSSGSHFSLESAGHLGFTGTSFWMDPLKNIAVILLTNRVHPSRSNEQIKQFRPYFHDRIMQTLQGILK